MPCTCQPRKRTRVEGTGGGERGEAKRGGGEREETEGVERGRERREERDGKGGEGIEKEKAKE